MTGRRQREAFVRANRDPKLLPQDRFEPSAAHSGKLRCVRCGSTGYGTYIVPRTISHFDGRNIPWWQAMSPWQIDCLTDHGWDCSCGRSFRAYGDLWRHIGAPRIEGWGRVGHHEPALTYDIATRRPVCLSPTNTQRRTA